MIILTFVFLHANQLNVSVKSFNENKIEINIDNTKTFIIDSSQLSCVDLLSLLTENPQKIIKNISKINMTYNLSESTDVFQYYRINSILLHFVTLSFSENIQSIEFNIQTNKATIYKDYLILQIISNLTKFTELTSLSLIINNLSLKIQLQDLLNIYYFVSLHMTLVELKKSEENINLKEQLTFIYYSKFIPLIESTEMFLNKNTTEGISEHDIPEYVALLLGDFENKINKYIEDIVNYYNHHLYTIKVINNEICITTAPGILDSSILFNEFVRLTENGFFYTWNTFLFSLDSTLN